MRGLPREEAGSSSGGDGSYDAAPSADEVKVPPLREEHITDLLFDEAGKLRVPPDFALPPVHLHSACISQELLKRNMAWAAEAL
jgi:hypothetical protein